MSISASEAAKALRAIPSERRAQASRENGRKGGGQGGRPFSPLTEIPCTCGAGETLTHKAACPRGRAIKRRERKGITLE